MHSFNSFTNVRSFLGEDSIYNYKLLAYEWYFINLYLSMILKIGMMYTLNSIGLTTEPWGIPYFKDLSVEKYLFMFTITVRHNTYGVRSVI